jgi:outer membrane protein OmpA-like peptidoglycan-associated protein
LPLIRAFALTALLALPQPAVALTLDVPSQAELASETVDPAGRYALPIAPFADGVLPTDIGEGEVTRQVWHLPVAGLTSLSLLLPLRDGLAAQGFEIVLDCATESCGGFDFRFATDVVAPPVMHVDLGDFRFLAARRAADVGVERIGILVSQTSQTGFIQIIRVGPADAAFRASASGEAATAPASAPTPRAAMVTGDLAARLEGEGRVILSDLTFQTGSAQLAEGAFASLTDLAAYLIANPTRRVALVGHTDSEGSLDANIALSKRRAGSVLERLVSDYDVPHAQLAAEGMGYLSPIAPNLTEAGRDLNRRVEVIITSTE